MNNQKLILKKWWFWLILLFIIFSISISPFINNLVTDKNNINDISNEISLDVENTTILDTYIIDYNNNAQNKITNLINFDVQDKNSGYYKTEFRLNAFNNAIAKHGKLDNFDISIIDYSSTFGTMYIQNLRIYANINNEETMKDFFENSIKVLDKNIMEKDFDDIYYTLNSYNAKNFVLGNNDEITGYIEKKNNNYEIMINYQKNR